MELSDDCIFLILEKKRDLDDVFISLSCNRFASILYQLPVKKRDHVGDGGGGDHEERNEQIALDRKMLDEAEVLLSSPSRISFGRKIRAVILNLAPTVFAYLAVVFTKSGRVRNLWICEYVIARGHLESLKYLREIGISWYGASIYNAAGNGDLKIVKYCHENGCSWDEWTCAFATKGGHLEVLKYAHENGCPWDEWTCANAASNGHLECLKYAHENGCPWDGNTRMIATRNRHLDCLEYAIENGAPESSENDPDYDPEY
jgi:hypothetical protein